MSDRRLALVTPPVGDPLAFRPLLEAALAAGYVASVHLRLADGEEGHARRLILALGPVVQERGAALLIDPPADLRNVARWGADGVHVEAADDLVEALQSLKPDRIVGVGGLRSKDAAMSAGERGADYVMFGEPRADGTTPPAGQVIERCQWWAEVFTTPCIGYAADAAMVGPLAATGVEFVALGPWAFVGGPSETASILRAARAAVGG